MYIQYCKKNIPFIGKFESTGIKKYVTSINFAIKM